MNRRKATFDYRPSSITTASNGTPYQCVKAINTLEPSPGNWYTKEDVEAWCNKPNWEITIIGNG